MTEATSHNNKREREGEPQDNERRASIPRTTKNKNIIFNFDGTGQDPFDDPIPPNQPDYDGDALSNVAKLHLLFGGDFREETDKESFYETIKNQHSLYYSGVGTYGSRFHRLLNKAFALQDVDSIIAKAIKDLRALYVHGDKVYVAGFSRGAAIARKFCGVVSQEHDLQSVQVELLICFDTVASIGAPDISTRNRPASDVIFEHGHQLAPNIKQAIHCVSIDDKRRIFQPTLMNDEDRVTEVWFAGAHSDIGGGYVRDSLSDIVLQFVLDEIAQRKVSLQTLSPDDVKYEEVSEATKNVDIDPSELLIDTKTSRGISHEQDDFWSPLYYHRELVVIRENIPIKDKLPFVHHSVAERIDLVTDYRPESLREKPHILYDNGPTVTKKGLHDYPKVGTRKLKTQKVVPPLSSGTPLLKV